MEAFCKVCFMSLSKYIMQCTPGICVSWRTCIKTWNPTSCTMLAKVPFANKQSHPVAGTVSVKGEGRAYVIFSN